jgi:hypothetical protein
MKAPAAYLGEFAATLENPLVASQERPSQGDSQNACEDIPKRLGPPLLSIPFGGAFGRQNDDVILHFWLCSSDAPSAGDLVKRVHRIIGTPERWDSLDKNTFEQLTTELAALQRTKALCSAIFDRVEGRWHVLDSCSVHSR